MRGCLLLAAVFAAATLCPRACAVGISAADATQQSLARRREQRLAAKETADSGAADNAWPTDRGIRAPKVTPATSFRGYTSPPLQPATWGLDQSAAGKYGNMYGKNGIGSGGAPFTWDEKRPSSTNKLDAAVAAAHILGVTGNMGPRVGAQGAMTLPAAMPLGALTRGQDIEKSVEAALNASNASAPGASPGVMASRLRQEPLEQVYNITKLGPVDMPPKVMPQISVNPDVLKAVAAGLAAAKAAVPEGSVDSLAGVPSDDYFEISASSTPEPVAESEGLPISESGPSSQISMLNPKPAGLPMLKVHSEKFSESELFPKPAGLPAMKEHSEEFSEPEFTDADLAEARNQASTQSDLISAYFPKQEDLVLEDSDSLLAEKPVAASANEAALAPMTPEEWESTRKQDLR